MKIASAILAALAATIPTVHARISSTGDNGERQMAVNSISEEWGHRSIMQEESMSMQGSAVMLSEAELSEIEGIDTIVGGSVITPHSRPYLVSVGTGDDSYWGQFCGGSLISPRAVMTAAHCITNFTDGSLRPADWVEFNRHDLTAHEPGVVRMYLGEADQIPHPLYDPWTADNDVAVFILPIAMTGITPVKLNENSKVPASGAPLDVAGWGATVANGTGYIPVPKATTVDYITNDACTSGDPFKYPEDNITSNMLCAFQVGTDSCFGDSGGPLVLGKSEGGPKKPVVQVGIVSWGGTEDPSTWCANPEYPGVNTRVSEVAGWVKETVCKRTGELCGPKKSSKARKLAN